MSHVSTPPQAKQDQSVAIPRISRAWQPFAEKLATTLASLKEDQYLILSVKHANHFVQFAAQGAFGMRVETTSNHYLPQQEQLSTQQIASLREAGWQAPTGSGEESTPEQDPDGSPNYFVDMKAPVAFDEVTCLTMHTFAEILSIPHPGYLEYEAFDDEGNALDLPGLGLKLANCEPQINNPAEVATLLKATLSEIVGANNLEFDDDGDIAIRFGSIAAFVRLNDDPLTVCIYSPIVRDVDANPALYKRLNDINAHESGVRFVYQNRAIWCFTLIPALPYVGIHVADAFQHFCTLANDMDSLLKEEFGGAIAFEEAMPSTLKH